MDLDHILYHLGEGEKGLDLPASPPIYQTSNFVFKSLGEMKESLEREHQIPFYTRGANPTVQILQKKIAALEATEAALLFSSGSAAITAAVVSQVKAGDHILCVANPYGWTKKLIENVLSRFGVHHDFIDASDPEQVIGQVRADTSLIFLESPNSWTYEMQDLEPIAAFARKKGIRTIFDNSAASPIYQHPAKYGIDIIVHSATKYLAGHSDVVAGALCTTETIADQIFCGEFMTFGGIISPFDAWLMIRSLRTLPLRLEKIGKNATEVAAFLEMHPKVRRLFYTHSHSFPQTHLVKKYLSGNGGLMTFDLDTDDAGLVEDFCNQLQHFRLGCSWGGYESLAFPALATIGSLNYSKKEALVNRVRIYVGLEDSKLLIDDLTNALEKI